MLPEDYPSARWRDFRLGERHCDGSFHPSQSRSDAHLRGRAQCDDVLRHLHFDAMQSDARIGHGGAMHLEGRLQTGWECENRGCLPFFRRVPVATDSDCVECDDQQLAYQRGTIIHFPIRIRLDEGYGKLFRHPTAVRRGVGAFRVAKHLHRPVTHDEQAEIAGRERDDALVGERTELFRDGLQRRHVVLRSTASELDVAVDRDDASNPTQSEVVVRIWRLPLLGYGML